MFSPAVINLLPFDPSHGAAQARQYCCKYAGKGEKYYFLETERDGVKDFLKARTIGLCMCHNRLLNFHVVRNTRPIVFTPTTFVPSDNGSYTRRSPEHVDKNPLYPDPEFFLGYVQEKYLFRNYRLRHLRIEQLNRYFAASPDHRVDDAARSNTAEDTCGDQIIIDPAADTCHRHFDKKAEQIPTGDPCYYIPESL